MRNTFAAIIATATLLTWFSSANAMELFQPFDSIKEGQWVRYEVTNDSGSETVITYVIESMNAAEVSYRSTSYVDGGFLVNARYRIPNDIFRWYTAENYKWIWDGRQPVDIITEELDGTEFVLAVFQDSVDVPETSGGGFLETIEYRSKEIPITGLFRREFRHPKQSTVMELMEYGHEIDEEIIRRYFHSTIPMTSVKSLYNSCVGSWEQNSNNGGTTGTRSIISRH